MKRTLLSFILVLTAITGAAQTVGDAIYFYRNDGGFNAFFRADIDSITFSTIEGDSANIDGVMVQTIHTPDSVYEIPLSVIDSVSFVNPETILQPDVVRMDESMLNYLQAVDGMTLMFNTTMPSSLRPKKGDLLLSVVPSSRLLSNGFAGKVTSISEAAGTLQVACARVDDVSDIFVQLIGVERIGEENSEAQARRNAMNTGNIQKHFVSLGLEYTGEPFEDAKFKLNGSLNGTLYGTYAYFFNLFNQVLDVKIHHEWDYSIGGEFKIEKSFEWPNEKSKYQEKTLWKFLFPMVAPVFKVELTGSPFVKAEGTAKTSFNYQSRKYAYTTRINYRDDKGFDDSYTEADKHQETGDVNDPSFDTDFSFEGSVAAGGVLGLSLGTIDFFGGYLHAKADIAIGPRLEADFCFKDGSDEAFRDFYSQHKDNKLELQLKTDVEIYGEAKFWGLEKAKKTVFEKSFTPFSRKWYLLPYFEKISAYGTSGDNSTATCYGRAKRNCLFPVNLGFAAFDKENYYLGSVYDSTPYTNDSYSYSADISGLSSGKVTVCPALTIFDHEIVATPSAELVKVETLPGVNNDDGTFTLRGKVYAKESDVYAFIYGPKSDLENYYNYVSAKLVNDDGLFEATVPNPSGNTIYFQSLAGIQNHSGLWEMNYGEIQIANIVVEDPDEPTPGQVIDLGLSVKWAGWDVGSDSPEEFGDLYAWGETETKDEYTSENYSLNDGERLGYRKSDTPDPFGNYRSIPFCTIGYETENGRSISGTDYDVAHVKWGGSWRMPTKEEADELLSQCTKKKITYKGYEGWLLTGPNGNKIFLRPRTTGGNFWTGTWAPQTTHLAWTIYGYTSLSVERQRCQLEVGRRIRAVCD